MPDNDIAFTTFGPNLFGSLSDLLTSGGGVGLFGTLVAWFLAIWAIYSTLALILSVVFIVGIIYSYLRTNQLAEIRNEQLKEAEKLWQELYGDRDGSTTWSQIRSHIDSDNPNNWKLAIIEADIMLDRALTEVGYAGNSLGEKLKSISPQQLLTLQDAWDAHVVRNKIAHEGSDFILTQRVAKETLTKYQRVLSELGVV